MKLYKISFLTAVLPTLSDHILEAAQSVEEFRHSVSTSQWDIEWIVVIDGPGQIPIIPIAHSQYNLEKQSGVSAARNYALSKATGNWVAPLDADDLLDRDGLKEILSYLEKTSTSWVAANRLFLDGEKTAHWKETAETWKVGQLAEQWRVPFIFHPNSIIVRREAADTIQGWPVMRTNEDLGFVFQLSEEFDGSFITAVFNKYRVWDKQTVQNPDYASQKSAAFKIIHQSINAKRTQCGRPLIPELNPGGSFGNLLSDYTPTKTFG